MGIVPCRLLQSTRFSQSMRYAVRSARLCFPPWICTICTFVCSHLLVIAHLTNGAYSMRSPEE
eukprot:9056450-Heterocapsa_arctica.AAC.2